MPSSLTAELLFEPHQRLRLLIFFSAFLLFPSPSNFFQWMPTNFESYFSFWVGQYRGIFSMYCLSLRSCQNCHPRTEYSPVLPSQSCNNILLCSKWHKDHLCKIWGKNVRSGARYDCKDNVLRWGDPVHFYIGIRTHYIVIIVVPLV